MLTKLKKILGYLNGLFYAPRLEGYQPIRVEGFLKIIKHHGTVSIGRRTTIWPGVKLTSLGKSGSEQARLTIGEFSSIGDRTQIHCCHDVSIGSYVLISWDVNILENNFHTTTDGKIRTSPIRIEDRVWIGCRVIILPGVTVGEGSIIAAGSVVARDVPKGTLVAGNPARVIRETGPWKMD